MSMLQCLSRILIFLLKVLVEIKARLLSKVCCHASLDSAPVLTDLKVLGHFQGTFVSMLSQL